MRNTFSLVLFIFSSVLGYADIEPALVKDNLHFNGMQSIGDHGFILIAESEIKSSCELLCVDLDLKEKWNIPFKYTASKKNSEPLDVQFLWNDENIYWVSQGSSVRYGIINAETGEVTLPETEIAGTGKMDPRYTDFVVHDGQLNLIENQRGKLHIWKITGNHQLSEESREIVAKDFEGPARIFGALIDGNICSYGYTIDRNHARMELNLTLHDVDGIEISNQTFTLKSSGYSFAFNSALDNKLLTFSKLEDKILVFGKMDYQFKGGYVTNPEESAFVGFWVATFNDSLTRHTFSEFPFVSLPEVIPSGTISRYVYVDLKEDENGDIFFNFSVQPIVFEASSYIFQLSPELDIKHVNRGKIEKKFFDYTKFGVRHIARSNNIIIRNDLWRYHSVDFLPMIHNSAGEYSRTISAVKQLYEAREDVIDLDKIFTFYATGNTVYFFSYINESGGTFRAYKAER